MSADFWAGYISGAASIIIGNPLDLIKVRLQASSPAATTSDAVLPPPQKPLAFARNLLRGLPAPVLTYGALNALLFTTYNRSLLLLSPPSPYYTAPHDVPSTNIYSSTHPYWSHFTSGCIAGLATFIISTPTELIKCRAQLAQDISPSTHTSPNPVPNPASTSSWSIARSIYQRNGVLGFYHGGVITSVRDAVGYGFYFLAYEASKDLWDSVAGRAATDGKTITASGGANEAAKVLLCGGLAGVVTWASIFPLDVIKTRVQTQTPTPPIHPTIAQSTQHTPLLREPGVITTGPGSTAINTRTTSSQFPAPASTWTVTREAYRAEGIRVFFRGMRVCCVRAFIVNAVQWAVYEWMMARLIS